eukprot:365193-Chlamydomonas_euryale.AAC.14
MSIPKLSPNGGDGKPPHCGARNEAPHWAAIEAGKFKSPFSAPPLPPSVQGLNAQPENACTPRQGGIDRGTRLRR